MRDDVLESKNKTLGDRIYDIGESALAFTAGAALLYRSGGARYLSTEFEKTNKFLSRAYGEVSSMAAGDYNEREIKNIYNRTKSSWNEISNEVENKSITLREENPNTLFGIISGITRFNKDPNMYANRMFSKDVVENPTIAEFAHPLMQSNKDLFNKVSQFIEKAATDPNNDTTVSEIKEGLNFNPEDLGQINLEDVLLKIKERKNDTAVKDQYILEHKTLSNALLAEVDNLDNMERTFGSERINDNLRGYVNQIMGDSPATIKDLLNNRERINTSLIFSKDNKYQSASDMVEEIDAMRQRFKDISQDHEDRFLALTPDSFALRKSESGEIRSFSSFSKSLDESMSWLAGTLPGKLAKLRDIQESGKASMVEYFGAGSMDSILASTGNRFNQDTDITDSHFFRIMNKTFRVEDGSLNHMKELDDTHLVSGFYGAAHKMLQQMSGNTDFRRSGNSLFRRLDIFQSGQQTYPEQLLSRVTKFNDPRWKGNIANKFLEQTHEDIAEITLKERTQDKDFAIDYMSKLRDFNKLASKHSYYLDNESVRKLRPHLSGVAAELADSLLLGETERLHNVLGRGSSPIGRSDVFLNEDLVTHLYGYIANPEKSLNSVVIKADRANFLGGGKEAATFDDILRMEIGKEIFLQHAKNNKWNYNAIQDVIKTAELSGRSHIETKQLASWATFQHKTGMSARATGEIFSDPYEMWGMIRNVNNTFHHNPNDASQNYKKEMIDSFKNMVHESISFIDEGDFNNKSIVKARALNKYVHLKKSIGPMSLIRSLNDTEKFKSTGEGFLRQFVAGGHDKKNITTATLFPYFILSRLSDAVNEMGFGFSRESTQSVGHLAKAIMLKRVAPVAAAVTYYNWTDDTLEASTGTSLSGSIGNVAANADLAHRGLIDAVGLTGFVRNEKRLNPMWQYWFGKEDYQDRDERKKYYESGYDPVRKGRYWSFGSVNEFRGGQVAYYEPNSLRQIHSDYKDKSIYDGYFDKWSHSMLPTPSNLLSPIAAILDPYWLENKHYDDRPYPLSGQMFSEETPWGAVLNSTIGDLIKPQIRMHKDRMIDGVDSKALIYKINRDTLAIDKSDSDGNLIKLKNGAVEPVLFTAFNAPTMSERINTVSINSDKTMGSMMTGFGEYSGGVSGEDYTSGSGSVNGLPLSLSDETPKEVKLSLMEKAQIQGATGGVLSNMAMNFVTSNVAPTYQIRSLNEETKRKAPSDKAQGVMTPEKIMYSSVVNTMIDDSETISELLNMSSGDNMIRETATSARLVAGIYGYMGNRSLGFGDSNGKRMATASDIDSSARGFWDSSIGGIGGETNEIARRFIPEFKRNSRMNPLMNTMPDWLPERFRMGDPFTKVPKGEMRLPGKGYESLNKLHLDMFGEYGALDRYKILADIAPYSPEYKIWKQIAKRTVTDTGQKQEIKDIAEQVADKSKQHEFYDYKFVGHGLEHENVTVSKIMSRGKFMIQGSDRVFKMAGIKLKTKEGQTSEDTLKEHLHVGQEATIAIDDNPSYLRNNDSENTISASVFIAGENLNEKLLDEGIADIRKGDVSAPASIGQLSSFQRARGTAMELVSHLDVPYFSDKFMRIRSPLESYKAEQVYGTPYQTWSDVAGSFINPAAERSVGYHYAIIAGEVATILHASLDHVPMSSTMRFMADAGYMLTNRGAFIGGALSYVIKPGNAKLLKIGARTGALGVALGHLYTGSSDIPDSAMGFGHLGYEIANLLDSSKSKWFNKPRLKGLAIGAAIGVALSSQNSSIFNDKGEWMPDRTKDKWKLEEYFDRLNYIKYMGLYQKAADKAMDEEGTNVIKIVNQNDSDVKNKKQIEEELQEAKTKLNTLPQDNILGVELKGAINKKINDITESDVILRAGKWTQAALLYKQAADSTMYGLKDNATWAQVIRALPKNDREYFMEFVKERDPDRREEMMGFSSPALKQALSIAWGMDKPEKQSNESYFQGHNLPGFTWAGWRPDVDMADVKAKTIQNEGMLLGDFGIFESETRNPDVINAPNLSPQGNQDPLTLRVNLMATLSGLGLTGVDISVEQNSSSTTEVVANIAMLTQHNIKRAVGGILSYL